MNELFYVPSIEEFHVGFEFEVAKIDEWYIRNKIEQEFAFWEKKTVTNDMDMKGLEEQLLPIGSVRVKSLEMDDITDCIPGLEYEKSRNAYFMDYPEVILWIVPENDSLVMIGFERKQDVDPVALKPNLPSFYGKIRNKSELKVLLKQLGI